MKKIAIMNKAQVLQTLVKVAKLQRTLINKLSQKESSVLDLSEKLRATREEREKNETLKGLSQSLSVPSSQPEQAPVVVDLSERKFLEEIQDTAGVWMHPFSEVHKDDQGFYILKSENIAGNKMMHGQLIADYAINMSPYWSIKSISGSRINLEPIGSNPFKSGFGAGGAKITSYDVNIFTGKYEEERRARALSAINSGNADIDDVKYLLLGTCPVRMGPNGAEGGWYKPTDTRSNRGGKLGLSYIQIIKQDAEQLKQWGFDVPRKALAGTISDSAWDSWIGGSPEKRELEEYRYDDNAETVDDLKNKILSPDKRANRIAIIKLMDMVKDGESSGEVLKDIIKAGGSPDYMCNEKIIYYFADNKDVSALNLCLEKLKDIDNKKLCYIRIIKLDPSKGEDLLKTENNIIALYQGFSDLKYNNEVKGQYGRDIKNTWAINFIKNNNVVGKIENFTSKPMSYIEKHDIENFLQSMLGAFGNSYFWNKPDPKFPELKVTNDDIALHGQIKELYDKVKNIKTSSYKITLFKKLAYYQYNISRLGK